jgi:hypothetical protein
MPNVAYFALCQESNLKSSHACQESNLKLCHAFILYFVRNLIFEILSHFRLVRNHVRNPNLQSHLVSFAICYILKLVINGRACLAEYR